MRKLSGHFLQYEIWVVTFFILLSLIWTRLLPLAIGAAILFWILRLIARRRLSIRTPADWSIVLLFLMIPVTLWITPASQTTLVQSLRLISGILFYYAVVNWGDSIPRIRQLVFGISVAGLGLALAAPFSVQWAAAKLIFAPTQLYDRFALLISDTVHPNVLAGSLVVLLPIPLAWLVFNWRQMNWMWRITGTFLSLVIIGMLALTQSRGALITLAFVFILLITLRWRYGWLILLLSVIAVITFAFNYGFSDLFQFITRGSSVGDLTGRVEIWARAIFMIQDFPFTGIGMGTFAETIKSLYPFYILDVETMPHAHNLFLQVGVDLGLPGLISWLAIAMLTIWMSGRLFYKGRNADDNLLIGYAAGLLLSNLAILFHGLTDSVTWGMVRPAPLVWGVWGMTVAGWLITHTIFSNHIDLDLKDSPDENQPATKLNPA